jgi:hypothetical protein
MNFEDSTTKYRIVLENFNISTNNIINVEAAKAGSTCMGRSHFIALQLYSVTNSCCNERHGFPFPCTLI